MRGMPSRMGLKPTQTACITAHKESNLTAWREPFVLKRALGTMALHAKWNDAPQGRLPPKEQAKLWALREVLRKQGEGRLEKSRMGM